MTSQELFGLPKWLTEPEKNILVEAIDHYYDVDIEVNEVDISSKAGVAPNYIAVGLRATGSQVRLFGEAGPHYVRRYPFERYFAVGGREFDYPYLMQVAEAPAIIDDVLSGLRQTYGLRMGATDVTFNSGDVITPNAVDGKLQIGLSFNSFRYSGASFPVYVFPNDKIPLLRLINPYRFLPGFRDAFFETDVVETFAGEVNYFSANGTRGSTYLRKIPTGHVFEEMDGEWEFGTKYLVPHYPHADINNWVSVPEPRFQNVYNARVLYNGPLRGVDEKPANSKLTHILRLRLDPKYSLNSSGIVQIYYRLLGIDLDANTPVKRLSGFIALDNCPYRWLSDVIANDVMAGLTVPD